MAVVSIRYPYVSFYLHINCVFLWVNMFVSPDLITIDPDENWYTYYNIRGWGGAHAAYWRARWCTGMEKDEDVFTQDPFLELVYEEQLKFLSESPLMWLSDYYADPGYLVDRAEVEYLELNEAMMGDSSERHLRDEIVDIYVFGAMALGMHGKHLSPELKGRMLEVLEATQAVILQKGWEMNRQDVVEVIYGKNRRNHLREFMQIRNPREATLEQALGQFANAVQVLRNIRQNFGGKLPNLRQPPPDGRVVITIQPEGGVIFDAQKEVEATMADRWGLYQPGWQPIV